MFLNHFLILGQVNNTFIYDYKSDSTKLSQFIVSELFDEIYKKHLGDITSKDSHDFGSIVLPTSTDELTTGIKLKIEDVSFSFDSKYLLVKITSKESWPKGVCKPIGNKPWIDLRLGTYFLFDYNLGEVLEIFQNVHEISFKNNNTLLISAPLKGSIYSLTSREIIFSKEGVAFFEFQDLNSDSLVILKEISWVDYFGIGGNKRNNHSRNNSAHLITLNSNEILQSFTDLGEVNIEPQLSYDERYLAFTIGDRDITLDNECFNLRDGKLICYDIQNKIRTQQIQHARFLKWASYSNSFVFYDYISDKVKEISYPNKKVRTIFNVKDISWQDNFWEPDFDIGEIVYCCKDSILIFSTIQLSANSFAEGYVYILNSLTQTVIKKNDYNGFDINLKNNDFFILGNSLYRYNDFSVVLNATSLKFDNSGKHLIINDHGIYTIIDLEESKEIGKGILKNTSINYIDEVGNYLLIGKSLIFDLSESKEIVNYKNDVTIDCVDYLKKLYIVVNENTIEFYNLLTNEILGTLFCNSDGWLFYDKYHRYDCSSSFSDQIYFSCSSEFLDKKMWVPNLWNTTIVTKNNEFIKAPKLLNCNLNDDEKNYSFRKSVIQSIGIPTVNYLEDGEKKVNLNNFSGKKVTISKAEILFQYDIWDEFHTRLLFSYFADHFGGYIAMTPDGYYSKSDDFYGKVALSINDTIFELSQIESNFYRPEIIYGLLTNYEINNRINNINRISSPPKIKIEEIRNDKNRGVIIETLNDQLTAKFRITATNMGGGIKGIRLFNNGKIVEEKLFNEYQNQNEVSLMVTIDLIVGNNKIDAYGISSDNTTSKPISIFKYIEIDQEILKPNLFVLGVGIDEYKNSNYNLNYCEKDMQSFLDALSIVSTQLYDSVFLSVIKNSNATKKNIIDSLEKISSKSKTNDVFVFYYAGHGVAHNFEGSNDFYFVTHDVTQIEDISNCALNGLSGGELKKILKNIRCQKQICIIDACNSGAFANENVRGSLGEENAIAKLNRSTGTAILASTKSEQYASEIDEIGHGVFTYALLKALAGEASDENCEITISGIENYLYQEIPKITQKYRGEKQFPTFQKCGQNFPLGFKCVNN